MEGRLACLFFFLAILYDDEVGEANSHRMVFGPDKQRNSRLVINYPNIRSYLSVQTSLKAGENGPIWARVQEFPIIRRPSSHPNTPFFT